MAVRETYISKTLSALGDGVARVDEKIKALLADKQILARILTTTELIKSVQYRRHKKYDATLHRLPTSWPPPKLITLQMEYRYTSH